MNIFKKMAGPFIDDIMIKLAKHRDFPEEQYEVVLENRRLREQMLMIQDKDYKRLDEENKELKNRVDELMQEKNARLEIENNILKQELINTHRLLLGKEDRAIESTLLTLGGSSETAELRLEYTKNRMEKRSEVNVIDIIKFKIFEDKMIYYTKDGIKDVVNIDNEQLKSIIESILDKKAIVSFNNEKLAQVTLIHNDKQIGHFYIDFNDFVYVSNIKKQLLELVSSIPKYRNDYMSGSYDFIREREGRFIDE